MPRGHIAGTTHKDETAIGSDANQYRQRGARQRPRAARRLRFEPLEERRMLATLTVTSLADVVAADGLVTLREAIVAAESDTGIDGSTAGNGPDVIEFHPSLSGSIQLATIADTLFGFTGLVITSSITIRGNAAGITIEPSPFAADMRLFRVADTGHLTLESLTLAGGIARGAAGGSPGSDGGRGLGGAVFNQGALDIYASTLFNHRAVGGAAAAGGRGGDALGGAIYNAGGQVTMVNSTLSANTVEGGPGNSHGSSFGGGVYSRNGSLDISNSTIANSSATAGRGVYAIADGGDASLSVYSSIIGQDEADAGITELVATADTGGSMSVNGSHNLIRRHVGYQGSPVSTAAPRLEPLADNGGPTWTHALADDSPALNQGVNTKEMSADQRGGLHLRVADGQADIGAFERQIHIEPPIAPLLPGDYNRDNVVDAADYTFWRDNYGTMVSPFDGADGDGDGHVDSFDYEVWKFAFGRTATSEQDDEEEEAIGTHTAMGAVAVPGAAARTLVTSRPLGPTSGDLMSRPRAGLTNNGPGPKSPLGGASAADEPGAIAASDLLMILGIARAEVSRDQGLWAHDTSAASVEPGTPPAKLVDELLAVWPDAGRDESDLFP